MATNLTRGIFVPTLVAVILCSGAFANAENKPLPAVYDADVLPVLEKLCFDCHGPEKQKGEVRFDTLDPDLVNGSDTETWHDSLDQINLGEMPPKKAKQQPTPAERKILTDWISQSLKHAAEAKRYAEGRVVMRRLTRYEYANTMRDLLGIDMDFARELPPEPASPEGFLNNGASLEMSPTQIETYLAVARQALDNVIVSGERPDVFHYKIEKTDVGKLPRKSDGGAKPVNPEFAINVEKFPRKGEFQLVIKAGAQVPEGQPYPQLKVEMGCVPGIIHVPRKSVGEAVVKASVKDPETFVFRGRMEDFPQPGEMSFGNAVAFKGMIVMVDYLDGEGKELRFPGRLYSDPPTKPKKGAKPPAPKKPKAKPKPSGPRPDIVIQSAEFVAPVIESWPPPSHVRLLGKNPKEARAILQGFMKRAFRRNVSENEVAGFVAIFDQIKRETGSFETAIKEAMAAVLVSPHFLYIVETRTDETKAEALTDFELATRLSYFLWSTTPDEVLLELAEQGKLREPSQLRSQTERMLNDPRADEFVAHFAEQWFDLGGMDRVAVNPEFYPGFDEALKDAMSEETRGVVREILQGDLSCLELLDSNWTWANRALAKHYGLADLPPSASFQKVTLRPEERRGGILGHGSFLLSNSDGERAHPIKRAVWILDRLIDSPAAPPPPDVPELDAENPDLAGLTSAEKLAVHREKESCNNCHQGIDPWGIPLEHFDATGIWREMSPIRLRGKGQKQTRPDPLESGSTLPDGTKISDTESLRKYLHQNRRELFARSLVKRISSYATGRSLDYGDRHVVQTLTEDFIRNDYRLRHLIMALVESEIFGTK